MLRLAARFWAAGAGAVRVGGVDVRDMTSAELMAMTSMVFQDVYLFDTTIRENLRIARPAPLGWELARAARRARLATVFDALPDGGVTRAAPGGQAQCGGSRRRGATARAVS